MPEKDIKPGLPYAIDAEGKLVFAADLESGGQFRCPYCDCLMNLYKAKSGKHVFRKNPGSHHSKEECRVIEKDESVEPRTLDGVDPGGLIDGLCFEPTNRGKVKPPPGGGRKKPGPVIAVGVPQVKTLRDFFVGKLYYLDPSKKFGEHALSEFLTNYKLAEELKNNPANYSKLKTIAYVWPDYYHYKNPLPDSLGERLFRFKIYDKNSNTKGYFSLAIPKDQFVKYEKKLTYDHFNENGTYGGRRANTTREVLVASNEWKKLPMTECKLCCNCKTCDNCFGMYYAHFVCKKQLYIFPKKENKN